MIYLALVFLINRFAHVSAERSWPCRVLESTKLHRSYQCSLCSITTRRHREKSKCSFFAFTHICCRAMPESGRIANMWDVQRLYAFYEINYTAVYILSGMLLVNGYISIIYVWYGTVVTVNVYPSVHVCICIDELSGCVRQSVVRIPRRCW